METRIKRQRQPTAQKVEGKERKGHRRVDEGRKQQGRKHKILIIAIMAVVLTILILLFVKGCSAGNFPPSPPDYEEDASGLGDDTFEEGSEDDTRINLAVMDDYTVNKDFPDFTVAYPSQNHYDIEISFREPKSGKEVYRTKRIRRGTVVAIPGYTFLKTGKNSLNVVIGVYDPDTWEMENEATTMKIVVTKE